MKPASSLTADQHQVFEQDKDLNPELYKVIFKFYL